MAGNPAQQLVSLPLESDHTKANLSHGIASHPGTPYEPQKHNHAVYTEEDFIQPTRIRERYNYHEQAIGHVSEVLAWYRAKEFFVPSPCGAELVYL